MRVFVLCTGRSGSKTFIKACAHISNYTAGHESRTSIIGTDRFNFPDNHIEADNRLVWRLGELDRYFGNDAYYLHLKRDSTKVVESYVKRHNQPDSIINAYSASLNLRPTHLMHKSDRLQAAQDFCITVQENIKLFLKDKKNKQIIDLEDIKVQFPLFWNNISAQGDLQYAIEELQHRHNSSQKKTNFFWFRMKRYIQNEIALKTK